MADLRIIAVDRTARAQARFPKLMVTLAILLALAGLSSAAAQAPADVPSTAAQKLEVAEQPTWQPVRSARKRAPVEQSVIEQPDVTSGPALQLPMWSDPQPTAEPQRLPAAAPVVQDRQITIPSPDLPPRQPGAAERRRSVAVPIAEQQQSSQPQPAQQQQQVQPPQAKPQAFAAASGPVRRVQFEQAPLPQGQRGPQPPNPQAPNVVTNAAPQVEVPGLELGPDAGPGGPCPTTECEAECDSCQLNDRLWFTAEYLLWWRQGANLPPLVATGALVPGTTILFGNSVENAGAHSDARLSVGYWLQPERISALEGSFLGFGDEAARFHADSHTTPLIVRPFFNTKVDPITHLVVGPDAFAVAAPGALSGTLDASLTTDFRASDILLRRNIARQDCFRIDALAGYRYAQLGDDLLINSFSTFLVGVPGTTKLVFDRFETNNTFNGAQLGMATHVHHEQWSLDLLMKLGLGNTRTRVVIDGATTTSVPGGGTATTVGGVLAQPTNIGIYTQDSFTMIPELGATLGFDLSPRLRATIGYSLIYWSKVARAGDQIDTNVNSSQFSGGTLVGIPTPRFLLTTTDFWAQGLSAGLEYDF